MLLSILFMLFLIVVLLAMAVGILSQIRDNFIKVHTQDKSATTTRSWPPLWLS